MVSCSLGVAIGWTLRGLFLERPECAACACNCHCLVSPSSESSGSWLYFGILVCLVLGIAAVVANFALAVKFSFSQKGDNSEVAIQVKGKSKGVYNPSRPLQITQ